MPRSSVHRRSLLDALAAEGRRLGAAATMHNHACAELVGVHPTDWECLDVLAWTGPITAGRLSELTGLTTGAVTGVVDRLERARFVRRVRDTHDRRRVIIERLRERDDELADVQAEFRASMRDLSSAFDDDQLETVLAFMRGRNELLLESTRRLRTTARATKASGRNSPRRAPVPNT